MRIRNYLNNFLILCPDLLITKYNQDHEKGVTYRHVDSCM